MILGIHLILLMGPTLPVPAPIKLTEALAAVEVTHSDQGVSGFQLTFQIGRSGPFEIFDDPLVMHPLLRPFNRVVVMVIFNARPRVLLDGFITRHQLTPSNDPGGSTLTVTGEDVSVMMDLEEKQKEHVGMNEPMAAFTILMSYMQYLLIPPTVIPPPSVSIPLPQEEIPVQTGTDRGHLKTMADRFGWVFYVTPGPLPGQNQAYWGPPVRLDIPQPALSMNMGADTNVESVSFQNDGLAPTTVFGVVQDRLTNLPLPVFSFISTRPPLVSMPALLINQPNVRRSLPGNDRPSSDMNREDARGGLTWPEAMMRAQAKVDQSTDNVVTATGELDALRYGELLKPRTIVGVRGVGYSYDGNYYVRSVTHSIRKGEYRQRFSLAREGLGSLLPVVRP